MSAHDNPNILRLPAVGAAGVVVHKAAPLKFVKNIHRVGLTFFDAKPRGLCVKRNAAHRHGVQTA